MPSLQNLSSWRRAAATCSTSLAPSRPAAGRLAHLPVMTDDDTRADPLGPVLTLAQLANLLGVPVQTLYDLRSHGGGPKGFRVGRQLRFRLAEVQAWLARLEDEDSVSRAKRGLR